MKRDSRHPQKRLVVHSAFIIAGAHRTKARGVAEIERGRSGRMAVGDGTTGGWVQVGMFGLGHVFFCYSKRYLADLAMPLILAMPLRSLYLRSAV